MSGEPKTLTPEEGTLEGLIATLGIHGYSLTFQEGRWWAVPPQDTPYEWCEGDTPGEAASKALGVPVVARDEAAELRAALVGVGDTLDLIGACVVEVPPSSDAYADANEILGLLSAAESILHKALRLPELRRLAGGESEK